MGQETPQQHPQNDPQRHPQAHPAAAPTPTPHPAAVNRAPEPPLSRPVRQTQRPRRPHRTKLDPHSEGAGETGPIGRERGGGRGGQH